MNLGRRDLGLLIVGKELPLDWEFVLGYSVLRLQSTRDHRLSLKGSFYMSDLLR